VMTGLEDEELGKEAIREGALDYLIKGQIDGRQLRRIIRFAIERNRMQIELRSYALRDELTGLHNRRGFLFLAEQQLKISRRNHCSSLLLFLDIDRLKNINDTFGHAEGNSAILEAAGVLRSTFRQSDILARLGGDEFAVLCVGTVDSSEAAIRVHLQEKVEAVNSQLDRKYALSFSIGMVPCTPNVQSAAEELLAKADALMYEDKTRKASTAAAKSLVS
jgi:two-component system cell cycle response regulator